MTQLSYMQSPSPTSMLDTEPAAMVRQFYVYILSNKAQTVLYTGHKRPGETRVGTQERPGIKIRRPVWIIEVSILRGFRGSLRSHFPRETDQGGSKTKEGRSDRKSKSAMA